MNKILQKPFKARNVANEIANLAYPSNPHRPNLMPKQYNQMNFADLPFLASLNVAGLTTFMDTLLDSNDGDVSLADGTTQRRGQKIKSSSSVLFGAKVQIVTIPIKKVGLPTGDADLLIVNEDGTTIHATIGTLDVSTLTTGYVNTVFTNLSNSYALAVNDRIELRKDTGGDGSNKIQIGRASTGFDGTFSDRYNWNSPGPATDVSNSDMIMKVEGLT